MNDEIDHKSGDGVPFGHPSTHSPDFVRSVGQDEGLRYPGTSARHPEPTCCVVPKDAGETAYGDDIENIDDTENIIDPVSGEITTFEAALQARYERLSLLTLDLATEAGESVRELPYGERRKNPKRFDRGIASMTKVIWAHRVIEKLRTGKAVSTEELAGLLPDVPNSPVKGPSTHSFDFVRSVAQNEGLGCGASGTISSYPTTSQHTASPTPEPHPEPLSKNAGEVEYYESTETKNEIEKRTDTPQTRKTEANHNNIQLTGELCGLIATQTGECDDKSTTYTDKNIDQLFMRIPKASISIVDINVPSPIVHHGMLYGEGDGVGRDFKEPNLMRKGALSYHQSGKTYARGFP